MADEAGEEGFSNQNEEKETTRRKNIQNRGDMEMNLACFACSIYLVV